VKGQDDKRPTSRQIDRSKEIKKVDKKVLVKVGNSGLSKNDGDEDDDDVVEKPKDKD
jgi:hypothetical protein